MIVSAFAIPVFSFAIPIYAYWHFDDFSWGNTRVVMGDKGKKHLVMADEGKFDKKSIPVMTWEDHEKSVLMYTDAFDDAASYQSTQTRPYAQSVHSFSRGPSPAFTNYGYGYPAYPSPSPPPGHFRAQSPFH
jgi:chitin synthase